MILARFVEAEHMIKMKPLLRGEIAELSDLEYARTVITYLGLGPTFDLYDPKTGNSVCFIGILPVKKGVGHVWMATTEQIRKHKIEVSKWIKDNAPNIKYATSDGNPAPFHRFQAEVDCAKPNWVKWMKHLGFRIEGRLASGQAPGEDTYMMSKIIER